MVGITDNVTVSEVMDLRGEYVCAEYVDDELSGSDAAW